MRIRQFTDIANEARESASHVVGRHYAIGMEREQLSTERQVLGSTLNWAWDSQSESMVVAKRSFYMIFEASVLGGAVVAGQPGLGIALQVARGIAERHAASGVGVSEDYDDREDLWTFTFAVSGTVDDMLAAEHACIEEWLAAPEAASAPEVAFRAIRAD